MERSQELEQLAERFYEAMRRGNVELFDSSAVDDVLVVGTDPQEWFSGRETATRVFREQMEAMGGSWPIYAGSPIAYAAGDAGWIADRPAFRVEGSEMPLRLTAVVVRSGDDWKVAHMHFSIGVSNEEAFGQELPA